MRHGPELAGYFYEHARDSVFVIDAETGALLDANRAAERAYGYRHDELLQLTIYELRSLDLPPVDRQMREALATGILFESVHRRRDGSTFHVEVSSRGEVVEGRACLFSIVRDITERKRLEAERDELLATTQHALTLREEFLMIASHELRAPITNISLQLQQVTRMIGRGASFAHIQQAAEHALRESSRLTTLIDALLDAQAARGPLSLEPGDMDLAELVHEVADRLRVRAEQSGTELVVDVPSMRGRWDRLRMDQVVSNLMQNALKYGGGKPIHVTGTTDRATAHLSVRDRGIGVRSEDLQRIFGKFERAVQPTYGGLGLGLFITRQIVEAHGGRIDVESVPGEGATFRVQLPVHARLG